MSKFDEVVEALDELDDVIATQRPEIDRSDVELVQVDQDYIAPWDQRGDEPSHEYGYFLHFRDSGLNRTAKATFEYISEHLTDFVLKKGFSISLSTIYNLSSKNNWAERARLWDDNEERLYQISRGQAVRDMAVRHEESIVDAIEALMIPVNALKKKMADDPDFLDSLTRRDAKELITMANQASRTIPTLMNAERLARGMPTEIVGGTVEHQHIVSIEVDQIGSVLEILERTGQFDAPGRSLGPGEIIDAEVVEVYPIPTESDDE